MTKPEENGDAVEEQQHAQELGQESRFVDQVPQREQPRAEEELCRHKTNLVQMEGDDLQLLRLRCGKRLRAGGPVCHQHRKEEREVAHDLDGHTDRVEQKE